MSAIELTSMAMGEPSPKLPHQPPRSGGGGAAGRRMNKSSSSNNNNNNNNEESKMSVRNLFAAATAGAPRPVTPVGPRIGSNRRVVAAEQQQQQQQVRVLSPDIFLDVGKSRGGSNNVSVFTNSMNLTVPVPAGGGDAAATGATPNGDVVASPDEGGERSREL